MCDLHDLDCVIDSLGLKVARLWSKNEKLLNSRAVCEPGPYSFGSFPVSWASSFSDCLQGMFARKQIEKLPCPYLLDGVRFYVIAGQYGALYFDGFFSFFVHGLYGEGDVSIGDLLPPNIVIPYSLLLEFRDSLKNISLLDSGGEEYLKYIKFRSNIFCDLMIDFSADASFFCVHSNLLEYSISNLFSVSDVCDYERNKIRFGEISVSEYFTVCAFKRLLGLIDRDELIFAINYINCIDDIDFYEPRLPLLGGLVLVCDSDVCFINVASRLDILQNKDDGNLPPVCIPTQRLVSFLKDMLQ